MDTANAEEARWLRHDDLARDRVTEVNIEQFLRDETPYLLFYQVVPIDGDPGNIMDGETLFNHDHPPAYSEHWVDDADDDPDRKYSMGTESSVSDTAAGESYDIERRRESSRNGRRQSSGVTYETSITPGAECVPRASLDGDGRKSSTISRRSSKVNALAVPNGSATQPEGNRLSASMSRFAGRLTRDKSSTSDTSATPTPPMATVPVTKNAGGPSLEVHDESAANEKGKVKKEKSKSKLNHHHHQHLMKGRTKSEKPDRECAVM